MAAQNRQFDIFTTLSDCFAADLAAFIGDQPARGATPTGFIELVEDVRDVLATASVGHLQDASAELDSAATYLTDALNSTTGDRSSLLAWARTHLRDAIATAC
ncbi:hypothetical protein [Streptomyces sp. NRRL S-337]|uniref:hypothetical protein n=1 Tax=Streptomyces sp. NRRL S-337 TaxID=1463900 RepID=UPI0004CC2B45|nr:hypothetical protein [Streptomyces sp. NRRL S-337]